MLRNLSTQFLHSPSFTRQVLTQPPSAGCQQPSGPQKGSRIPRQTKWAKFTALCGALTSLIHRCTQPPLGLRPALQMSIVLTPVLSRETKALEDQASHICKEFLLLDVSCPEKVSYIKAQNV